MMVSEFIALHRIPLGVTSKADPAAILCKDKLMKSIPLSRLAKLLKFT